MNEPPKLYAPNETIAAELRKLYPHIEVVLTPDKYPVDEVKPPQPITSLVPKEQQEEDV